MEQGGLSKSAASECRCATPQRRAMQLLANQKKTQSNRSEKVSNMNHFRTVAKRTCYKTICVFSVNVLHKAKTNESGEAETQQSMHIAFKNEAKKAPAVANVVRVHVYI